jgi:hypothetical protein
MLALARDAAKRHYIDAALVCAVIEQESGWDANAIRYEGAFRARYVAPLGLPPTEEIARSISWGLMQVMGQVAREHGFAGAFLSELCSAECGLEIGCAVLAHKIAAAGRQVVHVAVDLGAGEAGGAVVATVPHANCMGACRTATLGCVSLRDATATAAEAGGSPELSVSDTESERRLWSVALEQWNGGSNRAYAGQVLARISRYR